MILSEEKNLQLLCKYISAFNAKDFKLRKNIYDEKNIQHFFAAANKIFDTLLSFDIPMQQNIISYFFISTLQCFKNQFAEFRINNTNQTLENFFLSLTSTNSYKKIYNELNSIKNLNFFQKINSHLGYLKNNENIQNESMAIFDKISYFNEILSSQLISHETLLELGHDNASNILKTQIYSASYLGKNCTSYQNALKISFNYWENMISKNIAENLPYYSLNSFINIYHHRDDSMLKLDAIIPYYDFYISKKVLDDESLKAFNDISFSFYKLLSVGKKDESLILEKYTHNNSYIKGYIEDNSIIFNTHDIVKKSLINAHKDYFERNQPIEHLYYTNMLQELYNSTSLLTQILSDEKYPFTINFSHDEVKITNNCLTKYTNESLNKLFEDIFNNYFPSDISFQLTRLDNLKKIQSYSYNSFNTTVQDNISSLISALLEKGYMESDISITHKNSRHRVKKF